MSTTPIYAKGYITIKDLVYNINTASDGMTPICINYSANNVFTARSLYACHIMSDTGLIPSDGSMYTKGLLITGPNVVMPRGYDYHLFIIKYHSPCIYSETLVSLLVQMVKDEVIDENGPVLISSNPNHIDTVNEIFVLEDSHPSGIVLTATNSKRRFQTTV